MEADVIVCRKRLTASANLIAGKKLSTGTCQCVEIGGKNLLRDWEKENGKIGGKMATTPARLKSEKAQIRI